MKGRRMERERERERERGEKRRERTSPIVIQEEEYAVIKK